MSATVTVTATTTSLQAPGATVLVRRENAGVAEDTGSPSLERGSIEAEGSASDPLLLRAAKVGPERLEDLRKRGHAGRRLAKFYEDQNGLIDEMLKPADHRDADEATQLFRLKLAVNGSFAVNVLLFVLQLTGALLSGSLSLLATTADSFMDIASNGVLVFANRIASSGNNLKYPSGKTRYETAGIIVFATLMSTLSLQLIIESIRSLANSSHSIELGAMSISFVGAAIGLKFLLMLFCMTLSKYPSARILAQDHRNDLALNLTGILFGLLGQHVRWYIDPIGGIVIALMILRSWAGAAKEHIQLIVGKTAHHTFLNRITYISMTHDSRIRQVDTCRAYHSGNNFIVEVDIVLPPEMPLQEAHDIGEALQMKLETIEEVERAYVHLDYETSHKPEHRKTV